MTFSGNPPETSRRSRSTHATSVTRTPRLGATIALAFVKTEYAKPGTPVYTVRDGEHLNGTLCELPFA